MHQSLGKSCAFATSCESTVRLALTPSPDHRDSVPLAPARSFAADTQAHTDNSRASRHFFTSPIPPPFIKPGQLQGLREGATENVAASCKTLPADLIERWLATDRTLLFVIDGAKALYFREMTLTEGISHG